MTKEQLIEVLNERSGDPELAHLRAEDNLLRYLSDPEIKAAWDDARARQGWWYA